MPVEDLKEQGLDKNPNLELAQWKFLLTLPDNKNDKILQDKLLNAIKDDNMAPFYKQVCEDLGFNIDEELLHKMQKENEVVLKQLDAAIEDAEKHLGEMEVKDALLKKSEYLSKIGDKEKALHAFRLTYEKTVSLGHRLDLVFHIIRIGLFYMDHSIITKNIDKAKSIIEEGGDWDRRNRLKVYQGLYQMSIRDFKSTANLFLDTVSTFTSYELMNYDTFIIYTVLVCIISLPRNELREKVIKGAEILEVLHSHSSIREYLFSLYNFEIEKLLKTDRLLNPHYRYYVREMRILAYTQLLESYQSLTLQYMAESFGVTVNYIDKELSRFIAQGRLHCKIDKVGGIVETNRPDSKNWQYQSTIRQGDVLLNRIQKLSRVINI